jgi:radical SAM protein with 4Fe4S-binding SPASM domain
MREFCARFLRPRGDVLFGCGAGHVPCVDAYGALQPCLSLRDPELSLDVRDDPSALRRALTDVFPGLAELRATNPEYLRRCARCFLRALCEQCPAKSWAETGTLDSPVEYLCEVAHEQARLLGMLETGEWAWEVADHQARIARI